MIKSTLEAKECLTEMGFKWAVNLSKITQKTNTETNRNAETPFCCLFSNLEKKDKKLAVTHTKIH